MDNEIFRTRIRKVRLKAAPNLTVHVLDPNGAFDSDMRASFISHLRMAESWWPSCGGYALILTDGEAVTIAADTDLPQNLFWALMQFATSNPDACSESSDS
jgi:hypothetical protein